MQGREVFMNKKIIYIPLILFLTYFAFDKIFLIREYRFLTENDATFLYYEYKSELIDELALQYQQDIADGKKDKKYLVVLGSSRLMYFDVATFSRAFPEWEFYNFSAPVSMPGYYAFIIERILDRGIIPDAVVVESDPFQFNEGGGNFERINVANSFDLSFIVSNFSLFTRSEISSFLSGYLFAGYRYTMHPDIIIKRLQDKNNQHYIAFKGFDEYQRKYRGAGKSIIPREDWYERDFARLEYTAEKSLGWVFRSYQVSERQFQFLNQFLSKLRRENVPVLLIRPQVARPLEKIYESSMQKELNDWETKITEISRKHKYQYFDLAKRDDFYCNTFVDATHMSLDCYHPLMVFVMTHLFYEQKNKHQ